ncbi:MAG: hypothetical protein IPK19_35100 [Chloroflexi bacterium]|nr:hypothetical protein [Chloroflexota bacterium]
MKPALTILALLVMIFSSSLHAQEDYRLRTPPVAEFLGAVPRLLTYEADNFWQSMRLTTHPKNIQSPLDDAVIVQFEASYSLEEVFSQEFELLAAFYRRFGVWDWVGRGYLNSPQWYGGMILAWLRDNPTDLSAVESIDILGQSGVSVHPLGTFDDDDADTYWLRLEMDGEMILVLRRDATQPSGYRLIQTPLAWYPENVDDRILPERDYRPGHYGDLTGDDVPEWVIPVTAYWRTCGELHVLTWQREALVNVLADIDGLCPGSVAVENADQDAPLELVLTHRSIDHWLCVTRYNVVLDWNGMAFTTDMPTSTFDNTIGCALKQAERLMWDHQYAAAIPIYEAGLAAGWDASGDLIQGDTATLELYARDRLALAYALSGDFDRARTALPQDIDRQIDRIYGQEPLAT